MLSNSLNVINPNECIGNSLSAINNNFAQVGVKVDQLEGSIGTSVTKILAGTNISISPSTGTGVVTISSTINNNSIVLSGTNIGVSGASVFKEKTGQNLAFRKIASRGTNIEITEENDVIRIAAFDRNGTSGITTQNLGTGAGLASPSQGGGILPFKSLQAGQGIRVGSGDTAVTISSNLSGHNVGTGVGIYRSLSGANLVFKTIKSASPNVVISDSPNEVSIFVGDTSNAVSIGTGAQVFKHKNAGDYVFRTILSATPNVTITERAQDITIGVQEQTTGKNIGTGTGVVFAEKIGNELVFKTFKKGNNIEITDNGTEIRLDATLTGSGAGEVNQGRNVGNAAKVYKTKDGIDLVFRTLNAGPGITIAEGTNTITISAIPPVMGRGDVIGAFNAGIGANSVGVYTGVKTSNGILNFKSLSGDANVVLTQNPSNINISLSGVIKEGRNSVLGTGTGEVFRTENNGTLEYRKLRAGPGMSIITGTHDVIISSTLQASLDSLTTSYKNKIINGNFDIWQWSRKAIPGALGTADIAYDTQLTDSNNFQTLKYLADRWGFFAGRGTASGAGIQTATFSKQVVSLADLAALPSKPSYFGRITLNARATGLEIQINPTTLVHQIENIFLLAGKRVTLSFYAKSNNIGSNQFRLFLGQYYKSIGQTYFEPYASNLINTFQLSDSWQKYIVTFTIPSVKSRPFVAAWGGTTWNDPSKLELPFEHSFNQIVFTIPGADGRFVDISSVQLEEGAISTTFEPRPVGVELQLCQRYYEVGDSFQTQVGVTGNNLNRTEMPFKVTKRYTPLMRTDRTILYRNNLNNSNNTSTNIQSHQFTLNTSSTHARTSYTATDNLVITTPYVYNWAADAEFNVI